MKKKKTVCNNCKCHLDNNELKYYDKDGYLICKTCWQIEEEQLNKIDN